MSQLHENSGRAAADPGDRAPEEMSPNAPAPLVPVASSPQNGTARGEAGHLADVEDLSVLSGSAEAAALVAIDGVAADVRTVDLPDDGPGGGAAEPGATAPAADGCGIPVVTAGRRRAARIRRRPTLHLVAAVVGAVGFSLVVGGDLSAQADARGSVGDSVSVARALGIDETAAESDTSDAASRLGEMASSRAARDAEQAAAAEAQAEADRLASEAIAEESRPKAVLPVQGARLTSGFGPRWGTLHAGIDLAAPMRTPEYAVMDGVVLEAGAASGFGLAIYIQHANGDVTVYGHMDEILVQPGQVVQAGDTIALLGNRGQSTGPHLHFEVHAGGLGGERIDPIPWLRERGVEI